MVPTGGIMKDRTDVEVATINVPGSAKNLQMTRDAAMC